MNEVREQASSKRESIRELESKIQQRQRMVTTKQEKLDKLTMQHNYKVADRKATLEQLQQYVWCKTELCKLNMNLSVVVIVIIRAKKYML